MIIFKEERIGGRARVTTDEDGVMELSKIGKYIVIDTDSSRVRQKSPVNFGPLTTKLDM